MQEPQQGWGRKVAPAAGGGEVTKNDREKCPNPRPPRTPELRHRVAHGGASLGELRKAIPALIPRDWPVEESCGLPEIKEEGESRSLEDSLGNRVCSC